VKDYHSSFLINIYQVVLNKYTITFDFLVGIDPISELININVDPREV